MSKERVRFYPEVYRRLLILKVGILSKRQQNEKRQYQRWGIRTHSRTTIGDESDESRHIRSFVTSGASDVNVASSKIEFSFLVLVFPHLVIHPSLEMLLDDIY